ncbi:unnamed protein product, partial [Choristocarpus tenellus]
YTGEDGYEVGPSSFHFPANLGLTCLPFDITSPSTSLSPTLHPSATAVLHYRKYKLPDETILSTCLTFMILRALQLWENPLCLPHPPPPLKLFFHSPTYVSFTICP